MSLSTGRVESKNVAQFFAEHKAIAGFDNPGKSLFTTVREFVENSLDAAEAVHELPDVDVTIEHIEAWKVNDFYGAGQRAAAERKMAVAGSSSSVSSSSSATTAAAAAAAAAANRAAAHTPTTTKSGSGGSGSPRKGAGRRVIKEKSFYHVTVRDNGSGMPHNELPKMFGKVLSGTKYKLKQSRGRFGLGAKMALVHAKQTTAKPLEVWTAQADKSYISYCKIDIDMSQNEPVVLEHKKYPNDGTYSAVITDSVEGGGR